MTASPPEAVETIELLYAVFLLYSPCHLQNVLKLVAKKVPRLTTDPAVCLENCAVLFSPHATFPSNNTRGEFIHPAFEKLRNISNEGEILSEKVVTELQIQK